MFLRVYKTAWTGTISEEGVREWTTRQQKNPYLLSLPKELVGARHQGSHHSIAVLPWALVTNPSLICRSFCVQELKLTGLLVSIPNFLDQQSSKASELSQTSILSPLQWKSYSLTKPLVLFFCFDFFSHWVSNERKKHKVHSIKYLILIFLSFHTVLHSTVYTKNFKEILQFLSSLPSILLNLDVKQVIFFFPTENSVLPKIFSTLM